MKDLILFEKPNVKFTDVAGLDEVKERIKDDIVYPFIYPEEYKYFGLNPSDGILLYGPPGCGKTLLAAAAAAECDAAFINLKISDILDKYEGESQKNIKRVFELARSHERSVILLDEIDEWFRLEVLPELITQMRALETERKPRIRVLGETNKPWQINTSLLIWFNTRIFVPHPDFETRLRILEMKLLGKPFGKSISLASLAQMTEGYASVDIARICVEATCVLLEETIGEKKPNRQIGMSDFKRVIAKRKPALPLWYAKTFDKFEDGGEDNRFADLIRARTIYRAPAKC